MTVPECFPAHPASWSRLCRRARELVGAPSCPVEWVEDPQGEEVLVHVPTLWGHVRARFLGTSLVGLSWSDSPQGRGASWPKVWSVGWAEGTPFQRAVWKVCLDAHAVLSYAEMAALVGQPDAARAVGGALARNPLAPLVPCHWPGPASGALGGFRWGPDRKAAWRVWEAGVVVGGGPTAPSLARKTAGSAEGLGALCA